MRFLVAEGDGPARADLLQVLARFGECHLANNGGDAVSAHLASLHEQRGYDLVFLDMKLPGLDWLGVIQAVRHAEQRFGAAEVPIVILADCLSPREMVGAYYYGGCTDLLVKPVRLARLVELLLGCNLIAPEQASRLLADVYRGSADLRC